MTMLKETIFRKSEVLRPTGGTSLLPMQRFLSIEMRCVFLVWGKTTYFPRDVSLRWRDVGPFLDRLKERLDAFGYEVEDGGSVTRYRSAGPVGISHCKGERLIPGRSAIQCTVTVTRC